MVSYFFSLSIEIKKKVILVENRTSTDQLKSNSIVRKRIVHSAIHEDVNTVSTITSASCYSPATTPPGLDSRSRPPVSFPPCRCVMTTLKQACTCSSRFSIFGTVGWARPNCDGPTRRANNFRRRIEFRGRVKIELTSQQLGISV